MVITDEKLSMNIVNKSTFLENWQSRYFCSEINREIICLGCKSVNSAPTLWKITRHYEQHKTKYDRYKGILRQEKLKEFK